jgi:hypothetical protein
MIDDTSVKAYSKLWRSVGIKKVLIYAAIENNDRRKIKNIVFLYLLFHKLTFHMREDCKVFDKQEEKY